MDLNDPRRRLQVLNNSNPSIRVATAPQQQKITIAQPKTPNIALPKTQAQPTVSSQNIPLPKPGGGLPDMEFKGITEGKGKNKTIFGWNAAALLPKGYEKTYEVNADRNITTNKDKYVAQYDKLHPDYQKVLVNNAREQAAKGDLAAQNTLKALEETGRLKGNINDFAEGANDKLYGGISRGFLRGVDFVLPGHNTFGMEALADQQDPTKNKTNQVTTAGKVGEKVGTVEKGVFDLATLAAGGGAAEKAAEKVPAFSSLLEKLANGGRVSRLAGKMVAQLPGSLAGSSIDVVQTAGRGDEQNVAKSFGVGTAVDLGLPVLGSAFKAGKNLFKSGADEAISHGVINDLIEEVDPVKIEKALGIDKEMATYLANETDPATVKQILQEIAVDPNLKLSDDVRKRLEEEGITAVKQDANDPYAASYRDGVITARNQAELDANVNHEYGHAVWSKLTPEEKALFKGEGAASKQAVGRAGYTAEDVNSEDFADYMNKALTGRMKEVPENVQAVIAKYAKVELENLPAEFKAAIKEAGGTTDPGTVFHLPAQGVHAKISPDQANFLKDEVNNIPWSKGDMPHLTAGDKVRESTKEVSLEELAGMSPNAKTAIENADAAIAKQADEAAKLNTGTADAQVTGSGKTTNVEGTGDVSGAGLEGNTELGGNAAKTAENSSGSITPQRAEDLVPEGTDPSITKSVQDFLDSVNREGGTLDRAQVGFDTAQAARKAETGARIGSGEALYDTAGGGEQGFRAKLSALRGKKTASGYTPVSVDPEVETHLLDAVEKSGLRPYEKLNTQNALRKIWGANPEKPTSSDINNIRTFLNKNFGEGKGDEFADGITQALKDGRDWKDVASEVAGLPRALMATGDLSGGFRQAMPLGTRFPKEWANANKLSVEWAASPAKYEKAMREIADNPNYQVVQDLMGVDLTGVGALQDEAFLGAGLAEQIPVAGHAVKAADRAYTGVLTKLRWDVANKIIDDAGGPDQFMKNVENIAGDKTKDYLRAWGEVVNTFTGRGGKKGGLLDQHMKTLSTGLFAPRLWAANIQRLNPAWYIRLAKTNPQAAKLAVQSQGTFLAMAGTVLGMASLAGAEVGTDPRSADFGKIKVGNTRYDILGGQQQNIVQAMRQVTGQKVNSETGEVDTLGDGYGAKTRFDLAIDMLNNKSNPLLGFGIKLMNTTPGDSGDGLKDTFVRKDQYGNDFNVGTQAARLGIPLGVQGAYDTSQDVGNPVKGTLMNAPSFFGVGVQTYGTTPTKDQEKTADGGIKFKGKVTEDMVTDANGEAMLDEKGKPIRVKFDKNASETQKKAALKKAQNEAYTKKAKSLLSQEDADLYATGQADESSLSDDEAKKYAQIKKWVSDYGKNPDVPREVSADTSKTFFSKWNSMTKDDQEAWLKEAPDDNAKSIAEQVNKQRSKNLPEFKPSNELSKLYSDFDKDIASHPEYTNVDKQNKAKKFQSDAYKLNFSTDQRDIYNEGGSADLKALIDEQAISKKDLDEAIKLDNDLYNSGLTGSLKFSKTFRKTYGYGVPDGGGFNKNLSFSGGGSGSSDSVNQHLLDYLPSKSAGGGDTPAPQFSSRSRTKGISFSSVNTPKKGASKKVTINL